MIPRRQSSHLQIDVERSEILSDFCDRCPIEKKDELESIELVRGKLAKNEPPLKSPDSIPMLIYKSSYL